MLKHIVLPLAVVTLTAGCSKVPDAINPVEWYKSTAELLTGEEDEGTQEPAPAEGTLAADRGTPAPGADEQFPNLASVPERPQVESAESRQQIAEGLIADRRKARYSAEIIRRQGEAGSSVAANAPVAPPPPVVAAPRSGPAAPSIAPTAPPPPASLPAAQAMPAPPSPQRLAVNQPTMPASGQPTGVADVFRARIAEQNRLPSQMASGEGAAGTSSFNAAGDGFDTVVISSNGVTSAGSGGRSGQPIANSIAPISSLSRLGMERVATIVFSNGSSNLNSRDREVLAGVLELQRQRGGIVHVVGHASSRTRTMDPARHRQVNHKISAARADAVASALAKIGLPRDAIKVDARADSEPMYYEVMPTGEAGNRRAEIYLES